MTGNENNQKKIKHLMPDGSFMSFKEIWEDFKEKSEMMKKYKSKIDVMIKMLEGCD